MVRSTLTYALCAVWACVVGVSVVVSLCCTVIINNSSPSQGYNAVYVSGVQVAIGAAFLLPQSILCAAPVERLPHKWPLLGGLVSVASFITIPAGAYLGAQAVLLTQLLGMISGAILLDIWSSKLKLSDIKQWVGFILVFVGVVLDELSASPGGSKQKSSVTMYMMNVLGVYVIGAGYTFQASCNAALTHPLGSAARATLLTNMVTIIITVPLSAAIWFGIGVTPALDFKAWPLWLGAGGLGALYNFSFAVIPQILGYTTTYLMVLAGKLACSSLADAYGLTGVTVQFTWLRAAAIGCVLLGNCLFSKPVESSEPCQDQEQCSESADARTRLQSD